MNQRGEGWVIGQFLLVGAILLAPAGDGSAFPRGLRGVGVALVVLGCLIGVAASRRLGRNLTPFPKPRDESQLVREGLYGVVRHPIYLGVIVGGVGWALARGSLVGLALALLLVPFFDAKARVEEQWLLERYPDYDRYRAEVRRLIPWLY